MDVIRRMVVLGVVLGAVLGHVAAQPSQGGLVGGPGGHGNPGGTLQNPRDIIRPDTAYFIKAKGTQKVLDVSGGARRQEPPSGSSRSTAPRRRSSALWRPERVSFSSEPRPGGHFLTLNLADTPTIASLTQELAATDPQTADAQKWKVVESDEPTCFFIVNKKAEDFALQPITADDRARLAWPRATGMTARSGFSRRRPRSLTQIPRDCGEWAGHRMLCAV